jgi:hypothetical protein
LTLAIAALVVVVVVGGASGAPVLLEFVRVEEQICISFMSVSLLVCCDFRWLRLRLFFPRFSALSCATYAVKGM